MSEQRIITREELYQIRGAFVPDAERHYVVKSSGHGSPYRYDSGPPRESFPTRFYTLAEAWCDADWWIRIADTIGGDAVVEDWSTRTEIALPSWNELPLRVRGASGEAMSQLYPPHPATCECSLCVPAAAPSLPAGAGEPMGKWEAANSVHYIADFLRTPRTALLDDATARDILARDVERLGATVATLRSTLDARERELKQMSNAMDTMTEVARERSLALAAREQRIGELEKENDALRSRL